MTAMRAGVWLTRGKTLSYWLRDSSDGKLFRRTWRSIDSLCPSGYKISKNSKTKQVFTYESEDDLISFVPLWYIVGVDYDENS